MSAGVAKLSLTENICLDIHFALRFQPLVGLLELFLSSKLCLLDGYWYNIPGGSFEIRHCIRNTARSWACVLCTTHTVNALIAPKEV
jgi:hypothetical protein